MKEMDVVGVRVELPSKQPVVLLHETAGDRYLPIWIGTVEAAAIAYHHNETPLPRPLTHDLLGDVIETLGATLDRVEIVDLKEAVFFAELVIDGETRVSSRSSDAIALALRSHVPILCSDEVLDAAGVNLPDSEEEEVERFRRFLSEVEPEDFEEESGPGGPA
ncbi:bifunctional nuclease family protein [Salininema proteolyticum]|uniref:Bifunctional nuclease family protein n=1 Tax=Salininema proteolyticum TaxID=1607685 RepID=A0ABV8TUV8_9ACTN